MTDSQLAQKLFLLEPQPRERVWGGQRLRAGEPPIGEMWIAFGHSRVREGAHSGQTVDELAARHGAEFLGAAVAERHGSRFPLLVKLLDCADWLSVQVHPDDEQAARMVGPGARGKTEAWRFLDAEPGATIFAGVADGTTRAELERAIREGHVLEMMRRHEARAGETYLLPAGTLHAIGPGLLLYEAQQASDTTYRVYDWGRPASAERKLHIEESIAVADPRCVPAVTPPLALGGRACATAVSCPYFTLDELRLDGAASQGDTEGRAFHVLTVIEGGVEVLCGVEAARLGVYETVLVAGGAGAYEMRAVGGTAEILRATV